MGLVLEKLESNLYDFKLSDYRVYILLLIKIQSILTYLRNWKKIIFG